MMGLDWIKLTAVCRSDLVLQNGSGAISPLHTNNYRRLVAKEWVNASLTAAVGESLTLPLSLLLTTFVESLDDRAGNDVSASARR
jgi:hypothetical protein